MKVLKELKKRPKKSIVNLRVTPEEKELFNEQAQKYSGGNLTKIIKHAVLNFKADRRQMVKDLD